MNAPATPLPTAPKLAANQAVIRGRVLEVNRGENAVYTDIVLPAPDQYSQPQTIRVVSSRLLGKPQEDVTVQVAIKGYRRSYVDKNTGEKRYACDVALSAIDE